MCFVQDAYGWWPATLYFLLLITFGSLFTLNLALAIISDAYSEMSLEEDDEEEEEEEEEKLEFSNNQLTPRVALVPVAAPTDPSTGRCCFRCEQVQHQPTEGQRQRSSAD